MVVLRAVLEQKSGGMLFFNLPFNSKEEALKYANSLRVNGLTVDYVPFKPVSLSIITK